MNLFKKLFIILTFVPASINILAESGVGLLSGETAGQPVPINLSGEITLDDALKAAYSSEPELAAFALEIERNKALEEQAGKFPNLRLNVGMEEFGGSGFLGGTEVMKSRYGISQEFELGGKRKNRVRTARQKTAVSQAEMEEKTRHVETLVKSRFVAVYTSQQALQIQKENLKLVRDSFSVIAELVKAGEISPLLEDRAAVELATAETLHLRAEQLLEKCRLELAATWNSFSPEFTSVQGDFTEISKIPPLNILLDFLEDHPIARRWKAEKLHSQAELALAKSHIWPDLELGGGYQKFQENQQHAYYVEMSIPIPLFNRNQGGIKAARTGTKIAEKKEQYALLLLKNRTAEVFRDLTAVKAELEALNNTLVPAARRAYEAVSEAFRLGEEEYISVIDSQRLLLDSNHRQAELTTSYFELKAELEGLTGTPLENIL